MSVENHNHDEEQQEEDSELIEAQNQLLLLREHIDETNGKLKIGIFSLIFFIF